MNLMPAPGKMSRASMKADPTIPNTFFVPLETSVSVKASLEVIKVGLVLHSGWSGEPPTTFEVENRTRELRLEINNSIVLRLVLINCNLQLFCIENNGVRDRRAIIKVAKYYQNYLVCDALYRLSDCTGRPFGQLVRFF